jgi:hypothetical protein
VKRFDAVFFGLASLSVGKGKVTSLRSFVEMLLLFVANREPQAFFICNSIEGLSESITAKILSMVPDT